MSDPRLDRISSLLRNVPDFPKPGILFKDITPLLGDAAAFASTLDLFAEHFASRKVESVVGIEARGFIFGAALAVRLGVGFVPARKPGKLPAEKDRVEYALEYGTDALEMHKGSFKPGARVLVVDDVIATGGTVAAAIELVKRQGAEPVGAGFILELSFLGGRKKLPEGLECYSLLTL